IRAVAKFRHIVALGAMGATIDGSTLFQTVANDRHVALGAFRSGRSYCAFKTVEGVGFAGHDHLEGLVVLIAARIASCHGNASCWKGSVWAASTIPSPGNAYGNSEACDFHARAFTHGVGRSTDISRRSA